MSQRRARPADQHRLGSRTFKQAPGQAPSRAGVAIPAVPLGALVGLIIACVLVPIYLARGEIVDFSQVLAGLSDSPRTVGFLFDTSAYYSAFARVLEGGSPYLTTTLTGFEPPVALGSYRYLPPFALLFSPLALLTRVTVDVVFIVLSAVLYSVAVAQALKPLRLRSVLLVPAVAIVALNFCALTGYASGSVVMLTAPAYLLILDAPTRTRLNGVLLAATAFVRLEVGLFLATIALRERKLLWSAATASLLIVGASLLFPQGMQAWREAPMAFANIAVGFSQAPRRSSIRATCQ